MINAPTSATRPSSGWNRNTTARNKGTQGASKKGIRPAPVRNSRTLSRSRSAWADLPPPLRVLANTPANTLSLSWRSSLQPIRTRMRERTSSSAPNTASMPSAIALSRISVISLRLVGTRS